MKFHIAIGVKDLSESIAEYSQRLGANPVVVVANAYALWRTQTVNFSIRQTAAEHGVLRHLGFEDPDAECFSESTDCNGIVWERFSAAQQEAEIKHFWPEASDTPR